MYTYFIKAIKRDLMSKLSKSISQIKSKDPQLNMNLEREFKAPSSRREFRLNFEYQGPKNIDLPKHGSIFYILALMATVCSSLSGSLFASPTPNGTPKTLNHKAAIYLTDLGSFEPISFDRTTPYTQLDQHPDLPKGLLISLDLKGAKVGDVFVVMQGKASLAKRSIKVPYQELITPRYIPIFLKTVGWCDDVVVRQLRNQKVINQKRLRFVCME
jgi:hypothetical protein